MLSHRIHRSLALSKCPSRLSLVASRANSSSASQSAKAKAQAAAQRKAGPPSSASPRQTDAVSQAIAKDKAGFKPKTSPEADAAARAAEQFKERVELRKKLIVAIFIGVPMMVLLSYHLFKRCKFANLTRCHSTDRLSLL